MSGKKIDSQLLEKAFVAAKDVRNKAYAPYSKFHVGAALIDSRGGIISGCNVENASYGATICAERNAIFQAVAKEGGKPQFQGIVLVTEPSAVPCGECLQVMGEFFSSHTPVFIATTKGIEKEISFGELLPHRFGPEALA